MAERAAPGGECRAGTPGQRWAVGPRSHPAAPHPPSLPLPGLSPFPAAGAGRAQLRCRPLSRVFSFQVRAPKPPRRCRRDRR